MKPIFREFWCPECEKLRYIIIRGICSDCSNKKILEELAKQRKLRHQNSNMFFELEIEN